MSKLHMMGAVELRRMIGKREVSPVEIIKDCQARMDALNPAVNAICGRDNKAALAAAKAAEKAVMAGDELGPLHGLPVGIKDLDDTAGLLTTYGSMQHRGNVPKADNAMVARLRAAGAIIAAKTNTPEFGAGANTVNEVWGATCNAFDAKLSAAGSSGGSAVALATHMLALATGSDMGGSLRTPAAFNGVVGFRPSPGIVPYTGRAFGWSPLQVTGPMARSVGDLALLLSAQAGMNDHEPLGMPIEAQALARLPPCDLSRLRVGYTEDFGQCVVATSVREAFRAKVAAIRHLFHSCDEVKPRLGDGHRIFDVLRAASFVDKHKDTYRNTPHLLGPHVRANVEFGLSLQFADLCSAHNDHTQHFNLFQALYREFDLILSPMASVSPFPWRDPAVMEIDGGKLDIYYRWLGLAYVVTLATNPAICLPAGRDEHGLPFGLQIVGRFRGDVAALSAAAALEESMAKIPGLARPVPDDKTLRKAQPGLRQPVTHPPQHRTQVAGRSL